ncbi:hypothetical protein HX13_07475 [Chryseobacterium sp. P1-3]|nr:hypothetical protein HX13_07475 [Chryseobacterium sp. P1-3]
MLFRRGSIGVSVFFVISGFIMAYTTRKKDFSINTSKEITLFYKRRLIRIVPLYFLLSFSWMVMGQSLMTYFHGDGLQRLIHSILFLPQKDIFPVLYLGWSLNYEMFFYLIFGISLLFLFKKVYFHHQLFYFNLFNRNLFSTSKCLFSNGNKSSELILCGRNSICPDS